MQNLEAGQFDPPAHLSPRSVALWRSLVPRRARSAERLTLLVQALEALDRADEASRQLAGVGLLTKTPAAAMPHLHPLVKVEADARKEFRTLWLALSLQFASPIDGHHGDGWQGKPGVGLPQEAAAM